MQLHRSDPVSTIDLKDFALQKAAEMSTINQVRG
jgi:hypothetical protein